MPRIRLKIIGEQMRYFRISQSNLNIGHMKGNGVFGETSRCIIITEHLKSGLFILG